MTSTNGDRTTALLAPPARVLLILLGSIGDVVRALPLLGRMRAGWPDAHFSWAVEPKSSPILEGHPWINELIIYDRHRAPWSFPPFLAKIRAGRFDLVLDLQRHLKSGITSIVSGAHRRLGFARENVKEWNHWFSTERIPPQPPMKLKLMQYQAFGDILGLPQTPVEFGFRITAEKHDAAERLLAPMPAPRLAVILGSSWPSRIYSPASVAAVIRELAEPANGAPGFSAMLIGGPGDQDLARQVSLLLNGIPLRDLTGKSSLTLLPALFSACDAGFGPDCGPMHIAAAVGCPVVSLWGATAAARSAPWGFADYAITGQIPCSPCYLRDCPIDSECMHRIKPAAVAAMVRRAWAARPAAQARSHDFPSANLS